LNRLDNDDDLYNSYFRWMGTEEVINHQFLCRLCAVLHDDFPTHFTGTLMTGGADRASAQEDLGGIWTNLETCTGSVEKRTRGKC